METYLVKRLVQVRMFRLENTFLLAKGAFATTFPEAPPGFVEVDATLLSFKMFTVPHVQARHIEALPLLLLLLLLPGTLAVSSTASSTASPTASSRRTRRSSGGRW